MYIWKKKRLPGKDKLIRAQLQLPECTGAPTAGEGVTCPWRQKSRQMNSVCQDRWVRTMGEVLYPWTGKGQRVREGRLRASSPKTTRAYLQLSGEAKAEHFCGCRDSRSCRDSSQ